jgi:hypothetical protein
MSTEIFYNCRVFGWKMNRKRRQCSLGVYVVKVLKCEVDIYIGSGSWAKILAAGVGTL